MKPALLIAVIVGALLGLGWGSLRRETARLRAEVEQRRRMQEDWAALRVEQERLLRLNPTDDELRPHPKPVRGHTAPRPDSVEASDNLHVRWQPGAWKEAKQWRNRGRLTPDAAVETLLWAAASGDLGAVKSTIEIEPASEILLAQALAFLPESVRSLCPTSQDLLALVVAGNVPLESARWVALQCLAPDLVTAFVRLKSPDGVSRQVHLTVHLAPDGWRLRLPAAVVEQLVKRLPQTRLSVGSH